MKTYPIKLDDDLHKALRIKVAEMQITMQELILIALRAIVAQKEGTK